MAGNNQVVLNNYLLAASASYNLDIDRFNINTNNATNQPLIFLITTSASSIILNVYDGIGNSDPSATGGIPIVYGGSSIPSYNTTYKSYTITGAQTIRFKLFECTRWIRCQFVNPNSANITLSILGDF